MISAHARRSVRELTRRRGRSALTIATIAVAVAGVWLFAIPSNVETSLEARVRSDAMHTARLAPNAAPLTEPQLDTLRSVDNVAALEDLNRREFIVLGILAIAVLLVGLWPAPLIDMMNVTIEHLVEQAGQTKF